MRPKRNPPEIFPNIYMYWPNEGRTSHNGKMHTVNRNIPAGIRIRVEHRAPDDGLKRVCTTIITFMSFPIYYYAIPIA